MQSRHFTAVKYNIGRLVGRAGSPLPAAIVNQRLPILRNGAHGVTRPTCSYVVKNCYMPKIILVLLTCLFLPTRSIFATDVSTNLVNGSFEDGLTGWQVNGDVTLETAKPMEGKASLRIGPGAG